jgi:hypothetical protein
VTNQTGYRVIADATGNIVEIQAPSPDERYHTPDGLAIGTREQVVVTRLGAPSRTPVDGHERYDTFDAMGIAFLIDTNPKATNYELVNGIWVFAPHT